MAWVLEQVEASGRSEADFGADVGFTATFINRKTTIPSLLTHVVLFSLFFFVQPKSLPTDSVATVVQHVEMLVHRRRGFADELDDQFVPTCSGGHGF